MKLKIDTRRILRASAYALGVVSAVYGTVGAPTTKVGWAGFAVGAFLTAWGKYSTSTKLIGPDRTTWTQDERDRELGIALPEVEKRLNGTRKPGGLTSL